VAPGKDPVANGNRPLKIEKYPYKGVKKVKKLLFVLMACMLCIGLVGGAFAWFTDTETSTDNNFTAGVLDLKMSNGTSGWQDAPPYALVLATASNMAPGVEVGPFTVMFLNDGTMDGKVRVNHSYVNYDDPGASGEFATPTVSANAYAKKTIVTEAYLDGGTDNKATYWDEQIIHEAFSDDAGAADTAGAVIGSGDDRRPTIYGLSLVTLKFTEAYPVEDVWSPGESHSESFKLMLDTSADSDYAFDGIKITMTAELVQYDAP